MDITTATIKTPEAETETLTRIQPGKPLSFTNGVLKRHPPLHHHHHGNQLSNPPAVVTYKECLKNHAASLGGHAVDGCGEFMPSPIANPTDPTSLKCAACGCHRNFHRRDPEEPTTAHHVIEYQPHHRHHPPPPAPRSPNNSSSPPPISSSYYPSAPHMLLALSAGGGGGLSCPPLENNLPISNTAAQPNGRKRFRTKFTAEQKEKMQEFAEKVGWKMLKKDEDLIGEFCSEIGVERVVLKVWMHNNKSTLGKRDAINNNGTTTTTTSAAATNTTTPHYNHHVHDAEIDDENNLSHPFQNNNNDVVATNGSSSSS